MDSYPYRRRRRRLWPSIVTPLLLVLAVAIAAWIDVSRQHTQVEVFGQAIDIATVRQIVVQPASADGVISHLFTLRTRGKMLATLRLLGECRELPGGAFTPSGQPVESIYVELASARSASTDAIQLFSAPHRALYAIDDGHAYRCPALFAASLRRILY